MRLGHMALPAGPAKITPETIASAIFFLRGQKVMLDAHLAALYGVETKALTRAVGRNIARFPSDFMFQLSSQEFANLRRQFGTSSWGGLRYLPFAFTEQGIAMLSSVLNSRVAIRVNIQIVRVFMRMRELIITHKDIFIKLEQLEQRLLKQDQKVKKHDEEIQTIFNLLKELLHPVVVPRKRIGFKIGKETE